MIKLTNFGLVAFAGAMIFISGCFWRSHTERVVPTDGSSTTVVTPGNSSTTVTTNP